MLTETYEVKRFRIQRKAEKDKEVDEREKRAELNRKQKKLKMQQKNLQIDKQDQMRILWPECIGDEENRFVSTMKKLPLGGRDSSRLC